MPSTITSIVIIVPGSTTPEYMLPSVVGETLAPGSAGAGGDNPKGKLEGVVIAGCPTESTIVPSIRNQAAFSSSPGSIAALL